MTDKIYATLDDDINSYPWLVKENERIIASKEENEMEKANQKTETSQHTRSVDAWFGKTERPTVYPVVYRVRQKNCPSQIFYSKWDGKHWHSWNTSFKHADTEYSISGWAKNIDFEWQVIDRKEELRLSEDNNMNAPKSKNSSIDLLQQAVALQRERAKEYDPNGEQERSMSKTVDILNSLVGNSMKQGVLRESDGWLFMCILKMVRAESKDEPHKDSVADFISYASLYGEARLNGK